MSTNLRHAGFRAMGTYCEIQLYEASRISAKRLVRRLIDEVSRLESKYTRYRDDSFLSEINRSAGTQTGIKIDIETLKLFEHARSCYEQSDGLFDITAGVLRRVWDFSRKRIPDESELQETLPLIGYERLHWHDDLLFLPESMEIDFGGIVKEYAADSLANLARELGVKRGLINLGGDFAAIGSQPENRPWPIGITHPEDSTKIMSHFHLFEGGLASSGDYERSFILREALQPPVESQNRLALLRTESCQRCCESLLDCRILRYNCHAQARAGCHKLADRFRSAVCFYGRHRADRRAGAD